MTHHAASLPHQAGLIFTILAAATPALGDDTGRIVDYLETVQEQSLDAEVEYCGYFIRRNGGDLRATAATRGEQYFCIPKIPAGDDAELVASYHTHGTFSPEADSEVPSVDDIIGDREEEIDGYIATPGGRVWFHDVETGRIEQVCGLGCIVADPNHDEGANAPVATTYSLKGLEKRFFLDD